MSFLAPKRLLIVFIIFLITLLAFVISGCSQLSDKESTINDKFSAMLPELSLRYEKLENAIEIANEVGGERDVITDAKKSLSAFKKAKKEKNTSAALKASRELETIIGRLRANAAASPKLSASPEMKAAMDELEGSMPGSDVINSYENAVNAYEDARTSWRLLLSALFGGYSAPQKLEFSVNNNL